MKGGENMNVYYKFFLNLWTFGNATESQILAAVPKYISQTEADMILATPVTILQPLKVAKIEQA